MSEQKKSAVEVLQEMTKMFAETKFEDWAEIQSADTYAQEHPESDAMKAFCDRFGVSQENLHSIVEFLQCEPESEESKKKLSELIQTMTEHVPTGSVSRAAFTDWKALTQEAATALEELSDSWSVLSERKKGFETTRTALQETEKDALSKKEAAEQALEKLKANRQKTEKRIASMEERLTSPNSSLSDEERAKLETALQRARKALENQSNRLSDLESLVQTSTNAYTQAVAEREANDAKLAQAELELRKRTFADNATILVSSLPERMEDAVKRAPILEEATLDAKQLAQEVHELADKYQNRQLEYGKRASWLINKAEEWQMSDNKLVSWVGTKIIDKEIDRIQDHFTKELKSDIASLQKEFDRETSRTAGIAGFFNDVAKKWEDLNIVYARDNAMRDLEKINKYEKAIQDAQQKAELQALRHLKRDPSMKGKEDHEIQSSEAYKKLAADIAKARTRGLEEKRAKVMESFKNNYRTVHDIAQRREARYTELAQKVAQLDVTMQDLKKTHDMHRGFEFEQSQGFADDLQALMQKHNQQVKVFAGIESQTAQDLMEEVERGR